jgi:hypothetical protein
MAELEASQNHALGKEWLRTPFTVLVDAVGAGLGKVNSWAGGPNAPDEGTLRLIVAPR